MGGTNEKDETSQEDYVTLSYADLEQIARDGYIPKNGDKEIDPRYDIRVISYRKRKHDPDGVSAKAVLDGCVRVEILQDDSWNEVAQITFKSLKCKEGQEEETIIEFWQEVGDNELDGMESGS